MPIFKLKKTNYGVDQGTADTIRASLGDHAEALLEQLSVATGNIMAAPSRAFAILSADQPYDVLLPKSIILARKGIAKLGELITKPPRTAEEVAFQFAQPIVGSLQRKQLLRGKILSANEIDEVSSDAEYYSSLDLPYQIHTGRMTSKQVVNTNKAIAFGKKVEKALPVPGGETYVPTYGYRGVSGLAKKVQDKMVMTINSPDYPTELYESGEKYITENQGLRKFGEMAEKYLAQSLNRHVGSTGSSYKELLDNAFSDLPKYVRVWRGEPVPLRAPLAQIGYENVSLRDRSARAFSGYHSGIVRSYIINKKDIVAIGSPGEFEVIVPIRILKQIRKSQPARQFNQ